jgi:hypothetical protein
VEPDGGKDGGIFAGNLDRARAGLEIGADANHPGNPGFERAFDDAGQVRGKIRKTQMGVGIVKSRCIHRERRMQFPAALIKPIDDGGDRLER